MENFNQSNGTGVQAELVVTPLGGEFIRESRVQYEGSASSTGGGIVKIALFSTDGYMLASGEGPGPLVFTDQLWSMGTYSVYIRATDSGGNEGLSEKVTFRVRPLSGDRNTVSLLSPRPGVFDFYRGVDIFPIVSINHEWDPLLVRVEYYEGETLIGGASGGPYGFHWYPEPGQHQLRVKVILPDPEGPEEFYSGEVVFDVAYATSPALLWSDGPFGNLEVDPPGTITYDENEKVWRYYKPSHATSYRCESRNIRVGGSPYIWVNNRTYIIKWKSKITKIDSEYGDFVIFQWKSYPNELQNYPFLMTAENDEVRLTYVDTEGKWHRLWTKKTVDGEWNNYQLTIHLSDRDGSGWIQLQYNGGGQMVGGSSRFYGRTLDGTNEPKWGVYNRDRPGHEMEQYIGELKVYIVD